MKKVVWSETTVPRGTVFTGVLPRPPATTGPFQDVPVTWGPEEHAGPIPKVPVPEVYRDVAVIAFPMIDADRSMMELHPQTTTSAGRIDADVLFGESLRGAVRLPFGPEGTPAWIQVDFGRPERMHSMTLGLPDSWDGISPKYVAAVLESSTDGANFTRVAQAYDADDQSALVALAPLEETVTFAPVAARYFRLLLFAPPPPDSDPVVASLLPPAPKERLVTRFILHPVPRVNHFEQKAGYFVDSGHLDTHATLAVQREHAIRRHDIVDLTEKMQPSGLLRWTPPSQQRWMILRLGYSLVGVTNHPASHEATGLEVDKLDGKAVHSYMEEYLGRYQSIVGARHIGSVGVHAVVNDSYEAGAQNWTPALPSEFLHRRGYDLHPWLPALTGRIVESAEATDRFLWDFRRTLGELIAKAHYGEIAAVLRARGVLHYGESHETGRAFIGDGMDAKVADDIPMAAMWVPGVSFAPQTMGDADIRESASVAHIYGQNLVAAESMSAFGNAGTAFAFTPETLKPTADRELADGLNRFVIHTSVHQPRTDLAPGLTLGPFGQWFSRQETWAEEAAPWIQYLARSSYLLQQGHFVADVLYFYGQDSNITAIYGKHLPEIPPGYAFDFANVDALRSLSVRDGDLHTSSGMRYRLLALDPRTRLMSLDVLQSIAKLVQAGATVLGAKPTQTPSLADDERQFRALSGALWRDGVPGEHRYGLGRVLSDRSLADALRSMGIRPDFAFDRPREDTEVWYVHRRLANADLYFITNRQDRAVSIDARFRISGFAPELWHADSGKIEPTSYRQEAGDTVVPLQLASYDAVFVVFRNRTQTQARTIREPTRATLGSVSGRWEVHFQSGRGAPEVALFTQLAPWNVHSNTGIRYFSGTATYETTFRIPASWMADRNDPLEINLGRVKDVGEVIVNGQSAGVLWKPPFRADISHLAHIGDNRLQVRVTNTWVNRLIGDQQPNATKVAFSSLNPYRGDSPLLESGLLGPVTIERATLVRLASNNAGHAGAQVDSR
jgi:hypothetical protein